MSLFLLDAIRRPFGGRSGGGGGGADAVPQYDDVIDEHAAPMPRPPSAHRSEDDEDREEDQLDSRVADILANHHDRPGLARSSYDCRRVSAAFLAVAAVAGALVAAAFVVSVFFPSNNEIGDSSSGSGSAGNGLREPPYDISVVCSASYTQLQDGYDECRSMCAPASCCFTDDDERNCFDDNEDLCFMYESCANLDLDDDGFYDQDGVNGGSNSPMGHHHVVVPAAPSNLADICSPERTSSPDGKVICRDVCLVAACCWQHGESRGSCYEHNHEACLGYAGCFGRSQGERDHSLHNHDATLVGTAEEVPDHTVNELCRRDNPLGLDACVDLCSSRMCCFAQSQTSCAVERKRECITYAACGIVSSSTSVPQGQQQQPQKELALTPAPPDLDSICEADGLTTEGRYELCRATCGPSMCCGERSPPTDCDVEMCTAWGACASVWGSP